MVPMFLYSTVSQTCLWIFSKQFSGWGSGSTTSPVLVASIRISAFCWWSEVVVSLGLVLEWGGQQSGTAVDVGRPSPGRFGWRQNRASSISVDPVRLWLWTNHNQRLVEVDKPQVVSFIYKAFLVSHSQLSWNTRFRLDSSFKQPELQLLSISVLFHS